MSKMQYRIRGRNMIVWREQPPDFRQQEIGKLLRRLPFTSACIVALGDGLRPKVVVAQRAHEGVWAHLSERNVEMGGLLIGSVHTLEGSTGGFVVAVEDFVRSEHYESTGVSLTMESQVWNTARLRAKEEMSVVGWYHSHPSLGAFFSGTDRKTQAQFFSHPYSVGLVIDPFRHEEMWFLSGESISLDLFQIFISPEVS
ncbi:Mov34/MPN/PAD-1 family protein [Skermanella pratensis]|uniref:Mov34/MPN/PAD-1 family protein n=1 Tax=Skermanella pratensis TaxID=2233999 RepID=UPI001300D1FF|nr:Mov34/MPN/PAD-1 family protein [Skermanella pratensis]